MGTGLVPPTGSMTRSCKTRSSLTCNSSGKSPISSRKIEPLCASSKRPTRSVTAPVNAPLRWPKSSLSIKSLGMAAQLIGTKLAFARCDKSWSERATISLPVPLSPVISTVELDAATTGSRSRMARMASLSPIKLIAFRDMEPCMGRDPAPRRVRFFWGLTTKSYQ